MPAWYWRGLGLNTPNPQVLRNSKDSPSILPLEGKANRISVLFFIGPPKKKTPSG
jgi:hypothetical protein